MSENQLTAFGPVSTGEVLKVLESMKSGSPRDPVPMRYLKQAALAIGEPLTDLINLSFTQGTVPPDCKGAVVKALLKKPGLDPQNLANFRPISLLPGVSKMAERLANQRLSNFLEENGRLRDSQTGFRPGHGMDTALLAVHTDKESANACMELPFCIPFLLVSVVSVGSTESGCKLQSWDQQAYSSEGDIIIGGVFIVHSGFVSHGVKMNEEPTEMSCEGFSIRYYRDVLAMVFATEEINSNPHLLPNTTLGFRIFDSCMSESRASDGVLELLSGKTRLVPGYRCPTRPPLAGIIGESLSSLSVPMARIMGVLHYPQISHASVLSTLSDKLQFPSFLRTVPNYSFQNIAIARLIGHFQWTWVGMIVSTDEVGLQGGQGIRKAIEDKGGCVAFVEQINLRFSKEKILQLVEMIKGHSVKVIIVHSPDVHVKEFLQILYEQNITSKVWVFTAAFTLGPGLLLENQAWKILNGSLGLAPYTERMQDFEEFLSHLHHSRYPNDIFMKHFWEKAFHCTFQENNWTDTDASEEIKGRPGACSGVETLKQVTHFLFELNDLSYSYHSYVAAYAFAHALDELISCRPSRGPFIRVSCADAKDIQPWQVLHYLKNLHFTTPTGKDIFFDAHGDAPAAYDILNVQISLDETFQLIKVGRLDSTAQEGEDFSVNNSAILWSDGSYQVPPSVCSDACPPGFRKAAREGEPPCCFDCIPCSLGEISNGTDMTNCIKCLEHQWSNERRDTCLKKVMEFLKFEEPLGLTLAISSTAMVSITVFVLILFVKFKDTPIIKANNRGLSYLLLVALMFCFLCSFVFIGRPMTLTCMLRQTTFGIIFSISVSSVLAKTIIVCLAFVATHPGSSARKWLGLKTPCCIVFVCSSIQIVLCIQWLVISPPFPEQITTIQNDKIIIECNEGNTIFFYCMLGYMGLLATVSFIVAFLSRNLPGRFNEAKLITFSMLVFVSVWISFIPAYLSTRVKYMVAVEVFAILCSSAGLLGCIFFPKCYIILLKPERNTRQHVSRKTHLKNKDNEVG
ncbi:vomeronasal type-2 receptor 26-like [Lissotriton helveticus]